MEGLDEEFIELLGSWGGLSKKSKDVYIHELIKSYDIYCVQESWLTEGDTIEIAGFDYYRSDRKKENKYKEGM